MRRMVLQRVMTPSDAYVTYRLACSSCTLAWGKQMEFKANPRKAI
jgi:hypothetical protein